MKYSVKSASKLESKVEDSLSKDESEEKKIRKGTEVVGEE